jgi:two-component system, NtrC family, nitrogen regulation response regulator NtrX
LRAEAATGRFREDLLYRLLVIPLHLPPLRERREDIPLLCQHFLASYQTRTGRRPPRLADEAIAALVRHPWPGNIRELANILERLSILFPDQRVGAGDIRQFLVSGSAQPPSDGRHGYRSDDERPLHDRLDDYERYVIRAALEDAGGNVADAARRLYTDRPNLYRRMRRLQIER